VVNVHTREVLDGWQVAIADGRFAYVGPDAGALHRARTPR
jgi:adenine deaminase